MVVSGRCALVLFVALLGRAFADDAAPHKRNVVATSDLPRGAGLAAAFAADRQIATHLAVIFAEDFETDGYRERWREINNRGGTALSLVEVADDDNRFGKRVLRVTAKLGQNEGGGLTTWFEPTETVFIRFYTRFDQRCDYVHHFCTLRANRAQRGGDAWSGFGGAGNRPAGDRRFSTALEPWGNWGRWTPPGRWNFYSYWHQMEPSGDGRYWGNSFLPEGQPIIERGKWICAEFMLKDNTPGKPDGEQAFWIDGELRGHWTGINWRTDPVLRANSFTLESYVTNRWTKQEINIVDFDNVVIARDYVGPTGRAAN